MKAEGKTPAQVCITVELERHSRRIRSRTDAGSSSDTAWSSEIDTALRANLARICPGGINLKSPLNASSRKPPDPGPARSPRLADLERLGSALGPLLFGGTIGDEVGEALRRARAQEQHVLVHVFTSDPFLRLLPWETAALSVSGHAGPACWCPDLIVVRRGTQATARGLAMAGTLQVLLLVDDPAYFEADAWDLRQVLNGSDDNVYVAEPVVCSSWTDVAGLLANADRGWHVIVYAGHLSSTGSLMFRGESVRCAEFADRAVQRNEDLRCVVLLGCSSWQNVAGHFLEAGVPAVLGTNFYMKTGHPRIGLEPFLCTLAESGRVDDAYHALNQALPKAHRATAVLQLSTENTLLFQIGAGDTPLGNYARAIRDEFDRLRLLSRTNEGRRGHLYQQRRLFAPDANDLPSPGHRPRAERPMRTQQHVLAQLLRPTGGSFITVIGEAGIGKSAMLDHLAWDLARRFLANPQRKPQRIPFRMDLASWDIDSCGTLKEMILASERHVHEPLVERLLRDGSGVLLLDGLDEVHADRRTLVLQWLERQFQDETIRRNAIVIAGRPWVLSFKETRRIRTDILQMDEFNRGDIEQYVYNYFHDESQARELVLQLKTSALSLQLAKRPLFLMILCFLKEAGGTTLPATEGQLLEAAISALLNRRALPHEGTLRLLSIMAWSQWSTGDGQLTEGHSLELIVNAIGKDDVIRSAHWRRNNSEHILEDIIQQSGVLRQYHNRTIHFTEDTLLEYLAGYRLASRPEREILRALQSHAWNPAWARVLRFMVFSLWAHRRQLALRCVRWLLAEVGSGYDDYWHTLMLRAAHLIGGAGSAQDETECRLIENATTKVLDAWSHVVCIRFHLEDRQRAHRALLAMMPVAYEETMMALTDALRDSAVATSAAEALALIATDEATDILISAVQQFQDPQIRARLVNALGDIGSETAIHALVLVLDGDQRHVRSSAIKALKRLRAVQAAPALIRLASEGDTWDRREAIEALADIGVVQASEALVVALVEALRDKERFIRAAAAQAVRRIGLDQVEKRIVEQLDCTNSDICSLLGEIGSQSALRKLAKVMEHADPELRAAATAALGSFSGSDATPLLITALQDPADSVRLKAARGLAVLRAPDAVKPLLDLLQDPSCKVREAAVKGLGAIRSTDGLTAIAALLEDHDVDVKHSTISALRRIDSEDAIGALIGAFGDTDIWIRQHAALALVYLLRGNGTRVVTLVVDAAQHGETAVRRGAIGLLSWLSGGITRDRLDASAAHALRAAVHGLAIDPLIRISVSKSDECRREATHSLACIGAPEAIDALLLALHDSDPELRRSGAFGLGVCRYTGAIDDLVEQLLDDDPLTHWAAAGALKRIGGPRAVGALSHLLLQGNPTVRRLAAVSLAGIGTSEAEDGLLQAMSSPNSQHDALHGLGIMHSLRGVPALAGFLQDSDKSLRVAVVEYLGGIKSDDAVDALVAALEDEAHQVRLCAAQWLGYQGSDRAAEPLLTILSSGSVMIEDHDGDTRVLEYAEGMGPALMFDYRERQMLDLREAAAEALAQIGSNRVVDRLIHLYNHLDEDSRVRAYIWRALASIVSEYATDALSRAAVTGFQWAGSLLDQRCSKHGVTESKSGQTANTEKLSLHEELCPE